MGHAFDIRIWATMLRTSAKRSSLNIFWTGLIGYPALQIESKSETCAIV